MMYNAVQKQVLELLLNQYEDSKTYRGENKVVQSFAISPEKVFREYMSDYADLNQIRDFESQMRQLERDGLISIEQKNGAMRKLTAKTEAWTLYYEILDRQEKLVSQRIQEELYQRYAGRDPLLERFCREQIARLRANKKADYGREEAEVILKLCDFILHNQEDILERELSVAVLGDSKKWENKYRSKVCGLLRKYGDYEGLLLGISDGKDQEDKREIQRILLAEHQIFSNPSYVYFKGNAEFCFHGGRKIQTDRAVPMAFSSEALKQLQALYIREKQVVTVENLTSFNRMRADQAFLIFLSGYHNSVKQQLIKRLAAMNPGITWRHFGDIDPDGFYIVENLIRGTGIDFRPVSMDVGTLKKYDRYTKTLEEGDRKKAENLLAAGRYPEVMAYMLEHGKKLEQEIVSWLERDRWMGLDD